ncbi:hypothetical protein MTR_2g012640 [Medicago truncatula]|uniref:Uncharacterized protein n=1 Tax=Medicago truncatula TaxID=3880 RepID=G7ILH2_MEDTR|nr:hypothetical protein MTR_2g012640 [Medicago truncatula]
MATGFSGPKNPLFLDVACILSIRRSKILTTWGCSSNGRALALHARGTGFDPPHLHPYF